MAQGRYLHLPPTGSPRRCSPPTQLERFFALRWRIFELNRQLDVIERNSPMARVRMFGSEFTAEVLKDNGDGTFLMKAKQHTSRTTVGTEFSAKREEIIEMAAAEMPANDGSAALDTAMAEERKTLTPPAEVIAAHRAGLAAAAAGAVTKGVSVPSGPTQRR